MRCLPPLIEADEAIVVHIDLVEEACHSALWHSQASLLKGCTELITTNLAIMVSVYGCEEQKQLTLSSFNKGTEFCFCVCSVSVLAWR